MVQSHTNASDAGARLMLVPTGGVVDGSAAGLPAGVAGVVAVELELFTQRMQQGLFAAAAAVGLAVLDELQRAEIEVSTRRPVTRPWHLRPAPSAPTALRPFLGAPCRSAPRPTQSALFRQ